MPDIVRISGIKEFNKAAKQVNDQLPKKMRIAFNEAAELVAGEARSHVPSRSGKARASYRTRSTQRAARIAIGGPKAQYVPWLDFGGRAGNVSRPFYKAGRYLFPALERKKPEFMDLIQERVVQTIKDAGLEVT